MTKTATRTKTYDVEITRDGKWWMIAIPAIDGLTQSRRLVDVEAMAVSYISVDQDVPASQVAVRFGSLVVGGHDFAGRQHRLEELRAVVSRMDEQIAVETKALALELVQDEVPLRDVGEVLGVTFQRVHQLVSAS